MVKTYYGLDQNGLIHLENLRYIGDHRYTRHDKKERGSNGYLARFPPVFRYEMAAFLIQVNFT